MSQNNWMLSIKTTDKNSKIKRKLTHLQIFVIYVMYRHNSFKSSVDGNDKYYLKLLESGVKKRRFCLSKAGFWFFKHTGKFFHVLWLLVIFRIVDCGFTFSLFKKKM